MPVINRHTGVPKCLEINGGMYCQQFSTPKPDYTNLPGLLIMATITVLFWVGVFWGWWDYLEFRWNKFWRSKVDM